MRPATIAGLSLLVCFALIAPAGAQSSPRVVAKHSFDVDGDGKLDTIRIVAPAAVSIEIAGKPKRNVWKPLAAAGALLSGSISAARLRGATVIVATAEIRVGGKRLSEAVALRYARGKVTTLVREGVGPQGEDGEWSKYIAATPSGLLRYQAAPRVTRCDGKTPRLFPEVWDWRRRKFRATHPPVDVSANAPRIAAQTTAPPNIDAKVAPIAFRSTAGSSHQSASGAEDLSAPRELEDSNLRTAWLAHNVAGGRGEFATFRTTMSSAAVRAIRVIPAAGNRLTQLAIVAGKTTAFRADLPRKLNPGTAYWFLLPKPIATTCVTVIVSNLARTSAKSNTAIAELSVLTDLELTPGGPDVALASFVAGGGSRAGAAMRALRRRGKAAGAALVTELGKRSKAIEKLRLRRALAQLRYGPKALVDGLGTPGLSKHDYAAFAKALVRIGDSAVPALAAALRDRSAGSAGRRAMLTALTKISGPNAAKVLSAMLGEGRSGWRARLAKAIGSNRAKTEAATWLAITRAAASAPKREADAWNVLRYFSQRLRSPGLDELLLARLKASSGLGIAAGYELRYRMFVVAAEATSPAVLGQLETDLAGLANDVHSDALRRVTALALSRNPSPAAKRILVSLAANRDPGVRRKVALAFGDRKDVDSKTDSLLSARVKTDSWPQVRTAAASSLSLRCKQAAVAQVLYAAVDTDKDIGVRRVSLSSLVRCRAPGVLDKLYKLARNKKQSIPLRVHAVGEIAALGDRTRINELIAMFKQHRREAWSKTAALRLAAKTAVTLGRLGGNLAIRTLMSAARDDAFPEIQSAAVTGLGHICPRSARRVFFTLSGSGQRQVSLAARRARQKCFGRR